MNFAEDIEDVLIPDALEYYLGLNEDYFDGMGEDSDGSGGDSDEDGSGGDDDKDKKAAKKGGKGGNKKGGDGKEQQECKQQ